MVDLAAAVATARQDLFEYQVAHAERLTDGEVSRYIDNELAEGRLVWNLTDDAGSHRIEASARGPVCQVHRSASRCSPTFSKVLEKLPFPESSSSGASHLGRLRSWGWLVGWLLAGGELQGAEDVLAAWGNVAPDVAKRCSEIGLSPEDVSDYLATGLSPEDAEAAFLAGVPAPVMSAFAAAGADARTAASFLRRGLTAEDFCKLTNTMEPA